MASQNEPEFVDELTEDNICSICTNELNNPMLTDCCGQHFCEGCLQNWLQRQGQRTCPHCRAQGFIHIKSLPKKRQIDSLKIYCPNRSKGCKDTMTYSDRNTHLEKCLFVEEKCCEKCGEKILRKELEDHQQNKCPNRQVNCRHCQSKGMYKDIGTETHFQICPGYPLPCPNDCGQKDIQRQDIEGHKQVCPLELVACSFSEAGCGDIQRKDLDAHVASSTQQHLALVMATMTSTKKQLTEKLTSTQQDLASTQKQLAQVTEKMQRNFNTMASRVTRELDSISSSSENKRSLEIDSIKTTLVLATTMLERGTKYCLRMTWLQFSPYSQSDSFFVKPGYKMHIRYWFSFHSIVSVFVHLECGENDDQLEWPMKKMELTLETPDKKKMGNITICSRCWNQNLNRVENGEREIDRNQFTALPIHPSHLYIMFEDHVCPRALY